MGEVRKLENGPRRQSTNECEEVKRAFYGDARGALVITKRSYKKWGGGDLN